MNCTHCGGNLRKVGHTESGKIVYQCVDCGEIYKVAEPQTKKTTTTIQPVNNKESKYRIMTFAEYIGYSIFYLIPILGFGFLIADAIDDKYPSRRNFARFYFIPTIVIYAVLCFFIDAAGFFPKIY